MPIKHVDLATADDGPNDGRVQPSHWNKDHDIGPLLERIVDLSPTPETFPFIKDDGAGGMAAISAVARQLIALSDAAAILAALGGAPLMSPIFSGVPKVPTAAGGDNSLQIANTAFVSTAIAALVASSPATLDTLKELADALGDDPNFSVTMTNALAARLRFDAAQPLTTGQKAQALTNLGVILGSAAALNAGVAANNLVQLDGSGKLPAVDGSNLTNIAFAGAVSYALAQTLAAADKAQARANIDAQALGDFCGMSNGTLVASATGGSLTVEVRTFAGAIPSAADPVYFFFRSGTAGSGSFSRIAVTASLSLVIGSTKTMGFASGGPGRLWIAPFNDGGTVRLAAINCADSINIFAPPEHLSATTTVPGNAAKVFVSTTAIAAAAPWRYIGFIEWNNIATAGSWTAPDLIQLMSAGLKRPGEVVQTVMAAGSNPSTTSSGAWSDTSRSVPITPTSRCNLVRVSAAGVLTAAGMNGVASARIVRGLGLSGGAPQVGQYHGIYMNAGAVGGAAIQGPCFMFGVDKPATIAAVTYVVQLLANSPAQATAQWDNIGGSTIEAQEIMG